MAHISHLRIEGSGPGLDFPDWDEKLMLVNAEISYPAAEIKS